MRILRPAIRCLILILLCAAILRSQSVDPPGIRHDIPRTADVQIKLDVPVGTPLRVAIEKRVRIRHPAEPVEGVLMKPIYAFDTAVIPTGTKVHGKITRLEPTARGKRLLALANADLTPARAYEMTFDSLVLPDGARIAIATEVSPGAAQVVHLVSNPDPGKKTNPVARAAADAKKQVTDTVHTTSATITSPGRLDRVKRYMAAQLPFRRQFLERGTRFNAVLKEPLDFGTATRTSEDLASLAASPPVGSLLEAWLAAEVSSATSTRGTPVEVVVAAPLFSPEHRLVVPANTKVIGEVLEARPARRLHRNGELRVRLQRLKLPDGVVTPVHGSLDGIEVDRAAGLKLDAEGGARATDSRIRYASTGLSIVIAAMATQPDDIDPGSTGMTLDPDVRIAAGGSGLRLVGAVTSLVVRSQVFVSALGVVGAARSIYSNFLSRGRDVTLHKATPVEIGLGELHRPPDATKK